MIRWNLTGTENQKSIARTAFERIKFPFERLSQLPGTPELGWRNLNSGQYAMEVADTGDVHEHESCEDLPDALVVRLADGRNWTAGLIYTQSGRIYIDPMCEQNPEFAMGVISAELMHAIDFFLPMTDAMKDELLRLWGVPGTTWWEVLDYAEEYYRIGGEAFMHEGTEAYSDLKFGDKSMFAHDVGVEPADVRRILGIERTDYAAPTPTPTPKPPHTHTYVVYGKSKVVHRPSHYEKKTNGQLLTHIPEGFRPCKVCAPH